MRLAYIGYDRTALKTNTVLEQHFDIIDNYLINDSLESNNLNFFGLPIMADNVCIPIDESLYTAQHKSVLFKIKNEFTMLKKNLFAEYRLTGDEITGTRKSTKQQFSFDEIENLFFIKKKNKYLLQRKGKEPIEYDYLIVQGHQLVTDRLQLLKQNVMSKPQRQSFLILNLEFSAKYRLHDQHLRHDFIYIDNTNYNTVFDNWYICSYSSNRLLVSLFAPSANYRSEELMEFLAARARTALSESLTAFEFGPLQNRWISCADGFVTQKLKLNNPNYASVFPSFDYWTQNKINNYIKNIFVVKNKKNRALYTEKDLQ